MKKHEYDIIYPKWPKLERQTEFHLPPHGPVVFAEASPKRLILRLLTRTLRTVPLTYSPDIAPCRSRNMPAPQGLRNITAIPGTGGPVVFGGIATTLHSGEVAGYADAVFIGEAEGRFPQVIEDLKKGR